MTNIAMENCPGQIPRNVSDGPVMFIGLQNPFTIDISYISLYLYTDISTTNPSHYSHISYINLMMTCVYQKKKHSSHGPFSAMETMEINCGRSNVSKFKQKEPEKAEYLCSNLTI